MNNIQEKKLLNDLENLYSIPVLNNDAMYWFVRTNGGDKFEDFFINNYIGIGWDEFTNIEQLKNKDKKDLIKEIKTTYPNVQRPGWICSQIKRFLLELNIDDYVLIPNKKTKAFAFGKITSKPYVYIPKQEEIEIAKNTDKKLNFFKRINVEWITTTPINNNQDPYLQQFKNTHHIISDATKYKEVINRIIYNIYCQHNKLHNTLKINKNKGIELQSFSNLNQTFDQISKVICLIYDIEYVPSSIEIRAAFNSPGIIELISNSPICWLAMLIFSSIGFDGKINIAGHDTELHSIGLVGHVINYFMAKNKHEEELALLNLRQSIENDVHEEEMKKLELQLEETKLRTKVSKQGLELDEKQTTNSLKS